MKIKSIEIKNFKGIESKKFVFNSQFSVLIGNNATGKTTVLDALAVALGSFFLGIEGVASRGIQPDEIRTIEIDGQPRPQKPVLITANGSIDKKKELEWSRGITGKNTTSSGAKSISSIAKAKLENSRAPSKKTDSREIFPLIVYHGTGRLWAEHEKISYQVQIEGVVRGYANALTAKSSSKEFLAWVKTQEDSLKKFDDKLERDVFNAFKKSLLDMLPKQQWADMEWDFKTDALVGVAQDASGKKNKIKYSQLSDGYRSLVGMVADISYRCIQLNPHLGEQAVRETPGVVLIDELDLHLHPKWQRTVVNDLKRVFPNLQFIATTHSPFIIQSLGEKELINLDKAPFNPPPDELPLSIIVTDVMGLKNIRSDNFEERVKNARAAFKKIRTDSGNLTLDDYAEISRAAGQILKSETNDPELKAYLEESGEENLP